jgi:hypothetical protein
LALALGYSYLASSSFLYSSVNNKHQTSFRDYLNPSTSASKIILIEASPSPCLVASRFFGAEGAGYQLCIHHEAERIALAFNPQVELRISLDVISLLLFSINLDDQIQKPVDISDHLSPEIFYWPRSAFLGSTRS